MAALVAAAWRRKYRHENAAETAAGENSGWQMAAKEMAQHQRRISGGSVMASGNNGAINGENVRQ